MILTFHGFCSAREYTDVAPPVATLPCPVGANGRKIFPVPRVPLRPRTRRLRSIRGYLPLPFRGKSIVCGRFGKVFDIVRRRPENGRLVWRNATSPQASDVIGLVCASEG